MKIWVLALLLALIGPLVARAQDSAHDVVAPSLVYLTATGVATTGPTATLPDSAKSQGTGFFVSDDGFILTTRHFFAPLEKMNAENVQIKGEIGGPGGDSVAILFVADLRNFDLALLRAKLPFGVKRPVPVQTGDSIDIDPSAEPKLQTSGFHDAVIRRLTAELNTTVSNDVPYAMTLNLKTNSGQSGSPVYMTSEKGVRVVGMIKGTASFDDELTQMIPIEYALPLIGHLKFRKFERLQEKLLQRVGEIDGEKPPLGKRIQQVEDSVAEIGNYFEWTAYSEQDGSLRVRYDKIVGGGEQVDEISVKVTPNMRMFDDSNHNVVTTGPMQALRLTRDAENVFQRDSLDTSGRVGMFVIPGVQSLLETQLSISQAAVRGNDPFRDLEVIIVPSINGTPLELRAVNVVPDYEWRYE